MENKKVYENSGYRIVVFSDSGILRLTATRRALQDERNGKPRYYGSKWHIETHQRQGRGFMPVRLTGLDYVMNRKQDVIDALGRSHQFRMAWAELKGHPAAQGAAPTEPALFA